MTLECRAVDKYVIRKTMMNLHKSSFRRVFIVAWNVAGTLESPNGMTTSQCPSCVTPFYGCRLDAYEFDDM